MYLNIFLLYTHMHDVIYKLHMYMYPYSSDTYLCYVFVMCFKIFLSMLSSCELSQSSEELLEPPCLMEIEIDGASELDDDGSAQGMGRAGESSLHDVSLLDEVVDDVSELLSGGSAENERLQFIKVCRE